MSTKDRQNIPAKVIDVIPPRTEKDAWGYSRSYSGYVVVDFFWNDQTHLVNFLDASMVNVPPEDRYVGAKGKVSWMDLGPYKGWVWQKGSDDVP